MLGETVTEAGRRFGDRAAFVADEGWPLSFADLDRLSDQVAAGMARRSVKAGDVVALALPAIPEYAVAYAAAAKLGAVTAGLNTRLTAPEQAALLDVAQPRLVLATEAGAGAAAAAGWEVEAVTPGDHAEGLLRGLRDGGRDGDGGPGAATGPAGDPEAPVALVFTSGTTGTPKAALYCNRQLSFVVATEVGDAWGGGGPMVATTSPAHLGFMSKLGNHLRRGATQHLRRRWRADDALRLVVEHRMPLLNGVPTQVALMLRLPGIGDADLSAVRTVLMGGGPVTPALVREAREVFGAEVLTRYSATEVGLGVGTFPGDPPEDAEETVGRPLPGVELRVLDPDGGDVAPGEVGEVGLRSGAVMSGYWHDPAATAAAFTADGFVRTGDLGYLDDQGRLRLAGRRKEMYVRGGYNVYPVEVEAVLASHPGVAAVAVVPRPDPVMGEVGVAVVVARDGGVAPSLADLRDHAGDRLARHKLPEAVLAVDDLPLTAMDKVDRRALTRLVADPDADKPPAPPPPRS
jgi:acyl-CoA synthetase (AMP-forming)/AMP-acid ligase II